MRTLKLAGLLVTATLALASCGGGNGSTATNPTTPTNTADADLPDDTFADDDAGQVTAEKTINLSSGQAAALGFTTQGVDSGPVTVTAQILRATTGKYAGQVKGALTLTYTGAVNYKGPFTLKLADSAGNLISKRKNDSKDSPDVSLKPTKNKPATVKKLTIQYGNALNGAACMYLAYDLKDNAGAGPAEIKYDNAQPLLCEPDGSSQSPVQAALLTASAGYLYAAQPWQSVNVSGPAAPAATLASVPAEIEGANKQDFEAFFAPLMATPTDTTTAEGKAAAAKAKQAKKLHDAYLKLFKPENLGVYVTANTTYVVGANSWGVTGLKANK